MSDTKKYLYSLDYLIYGETEDEMAYVMIDTIDANRTKLITQADLIKTILDGDRTIGGDQSSDVTTNGGAQRLTNKTLLEPTLIDPLFALTPPSGGNTVNVTEADMYNVHVTLMGALTDAGFEDGKRLAEVADNLDRQTFCAMVEKQSDSNKKIVITAADLFTASGLEATNRYIDIRSLAISVWTAATLTYTLKQDWTAEAAASAGTKLSNVTITTIATAGTAHSVAVHFRLAE